MIAYACRYGHQRKADVDEWSPDVLHEFVENLGYWVRLENPPDRDNEPDSE